MLECENLTVIYSNGVKALDNVNLKFSNTGLYYIIGHSGSGKSTFLNVLLGNQNIVFDYLFISSHKPV